jgi:multidrug transporter EmrE-like cation transporter
MFAASAVLQLIGLIMLPLTKGFTEPMPTLGAALSFLVGIGLLARLIHSGVNLSALIPLLAATVPLATIAFGVLVYGESASLLKITMLVSACGLIGFASAM